MANTEIKTGSNFSQDEIIESLKKHALWQKNNDDPQGVRLDWSNSISDGCTLINVNLKNADLSGASFKNADLSFSDLSGADLMGVDFSDATLTSTIFTGANMRGAICTAAKMRDSILRDAKLSYTTFCGAIMEKADLVGANLGEEEALSHADFSCAQLDGAIFRGE